MEENILTKIAEKTRERVAEEKRIFPMSQVKKEAEDAVAYQSKKEAKATKAYENKNETGATKTYEKKNESKDEAVVKKNKPHDFLAALKKPGLSYICEVKKASPSKGVIAEDFPYLQIAKEYEEAGASAVSVLTEPFFFQGEDRFLSEITDEITIPALRKDFLVDEYMVYKAKALGASAVLLLCNILDDSELKAYRELAEELHMNALVEAYDEKELIRALDSGAKIVGVNNRDLRTFKVDTNRSVEFRKQVPPEIVFVSESGVKTVEDIRKMKEANVDAVLIGETLMRAPDKKAKLHELDS